MFEPTWHGPTQDLAGAYQLLKKMGVVVSAHLEHRDRAVLDLYFSRATVEAAGTPLPKVAEPAVLLVDSNAEVRWMLVSHFSANGNRLLAASGCDEAFLLAELYPGAIPLVIANLPREHPARETFSEKMAILRPRAGIRLICGYKAPREAAAGERLDPASEHQITKWELLEWARQSVTTPIPTR
jgi:hypothetical protein